MRKPIKAHQGKIVYDEQAASPVSDYNPPTTPKATATQVGTALGTPFQPFMPRRRPRVFGGTQIPRRQYDNPYQNIYDQQRNIFQQNQLPLFSQLQQAQPFQQTQQAQQAQQALEQDLYKQQQMAFNQMAFNKGGMNMEQQMDLFEQGGMQDDGLDKDPISGNDIPPGSLAKEVRDDVPAQLSEGEYVVPADVVQYYGVKFFEDLRMEAKMGLSQMDREGRIGGEPVEVDMTMIAFGKKDKEDKKKKANGGVIHANTGVAVSPEAKSANQAGTFNPADYGVVGFTPTSPVNQTGKGSTPANTTKQVTYYHGQTGEAKTVTFVNGVVTPPSDLQFTQPPWSVNKPTPTQQKTGDSSDKKKTEPEVPQYLKDTDFTTWNGKNYMNEATNALKRDMGENFFGAFATLALGPAGLLVNEMIDMDGIAKASIMADAAREAGFEEQADAIEQQIKDHIENESSFATRNLLGTELGQKILNGAKTRIADQLSKSNKTWGQSGGSNNQGQGQGGGGTLTPTKGSIKADGTVDYTGGTKDSGFTIASKDRDDDGGVTINAINSEGKVSPVKMTKKQVDETKAFNEKYAVDESDADSFDDFNKGGLLSRPKRNPKKPRGKGLGSK
jgi:hypothetical protein